MLVLNTELLVLSPRWTRQLQVLRGIESESSSHESDADRLHGESRRVFTLPF